MLPAEFTGTREQKELSDLAEDTKGLVVLTRICEALGRLGERLGKDWAPDASGVAKALSNVVSRYGKPDIASRQTHYRLVFFKQGYNGFWVGLEDGQEKIFWNIKSSYHALRKAPAQQDAFAYLGKWDLLMRGLTLLALGGHRPLNAVLNVVASWDNKNHFVGLTRMLSAMLDPSCIQKLQPEERREWVNNIEDLQDYFHVDNENLQNLPGVPSTIKISALAWETAANLTSRALAWPAVNDTITLFSHRSLLSGQSGASYVHTKFVVSNYLNYLQNPVMEGSVELAHKKAVLRFDLWRTGWTGLLENSAIGGGLNAKCFGDFVALFDKLAQAEQKSRKVTGRPISPYPEELPGFERASLVPDPGEQVHFWCRRLSGASDVVKGALQPVRVLLTPASLAGLHDLMLRLEQTISIGIEALPEILNAALQGVSFERWSWDMYVAPAQLELVRMLDVDFEIKDSFWSVLWPKIAESIPQLSVDALSTWQDSCIKRNQVMSPLFTKLLHESLREVSKSTPVSSAVFKPRSQRL